MYARWASFVVGLWLLLAPLVLGYETVAPILHDVALGTLVCVATLAALEWPLCRFVLAAPGVWLIWCGQSSAWSSGSAAAVELAAGAALLLLVPIPSARLAAGRAAARMPV
jgi:hypothetical protein